MMSTFTFDTELHLTDNTSLLLHKSNKYYLLVLVLNKQEPEPNFFYYWYTVY